MIYYCASLTYVNLSHMSFCPVPGYCSVYILFMSRNGTVKSYSTIDNYGQGGGPNLAVLQDFTGFGSSIVAIGDLNHDGIADLAIGANTVYDAGSKNLNAGAVFVCFMNRNGSVQSYSRISELSGRPKYSLPLVVRACFVQLIPTESTILLY